ncbi:hypothetical protein FHS95_000126 [Sphingomonas naasensis]|uniref:Uncharacterized protein n=1 Tax=Sphingomonas naasensis TaxID=1344951 RepID=A0A4S1WU57_9SPHN|nr:hypothetical protein [Sphingomonas naasensis]NIJ18457.1 hypothetical protein [Sphingomonas naasensis]TGX45720.1 hypothetical protein E5A74_00620 [Sphingomonas naasensis]
MEDPPFWLVWCPSGDHAPRFKHGSVSSAEREAERLADLHPGREFYVVQPTYHVVSQRRLTQRFSTDGIPF